MRSMTPPSVLLDRCFLDALADTAHPQAQRATASYQTLLERFRRNERRLRARADHLAAVALDRSVRRGLFAPIEAIHLAAQHHRAAQRLDLPVEVDDDDALTLVLLRREGISEVATFDSVLGRFDLLIVD